MRKFLKAYNYILLSAFCFMLVLKYGKYLLQDFNFKQVLGDYAQKIYSEKIHLFTFFSSILYWIFIYNLFIK